MPSPILTSQDWSKYFEYCDIRIVQGLYQRFSETPLDFPKSSMVMNLTDREYLIYFDNEIYRRIRIDFQEIEALDIHKIMPSKLFLFKKLLEKQIEQYLTRSLRNN